MAYNRKTWKNRSSQYPTRRRLAKVSESELEMVVDVSREEGTISQTGDQFSASSMNDLEGRIEAAFEDTGGGNFVGVRYHASLADYPGYPCWEDMSASEKEKYDVETGATVNFLDDDIPEDIIGDTDISGIADGTLTGAIAEHDEDIADLNSELSRQVLYSNSAGYSKATYLNTLYTFMNDNNFEKLSIIFHTTYGGQSYKTIYKPVRNYQGYVFTATFTTGAALAVETVEAKASSGSKAYLYSGGNVSDVSTQSITKCELVLN